MSSKFLYRRWCCAVIVVLGFLVAAVSPGMAQRPQLKRPNEDNQEKPPAPPPKKKVKGPRAVGLLQFGDKTTTLIPVAILVDGRFYDASAYKAEPVPMAIERGTVYEAEQTGESQGLFTINGALHSKSPNSAHPWVGSGSYLANGTEAAKTTRKAEDKPVGIDSSGDDAPPRLTRGSGSEPKNENTAPAPTAAKPSSASSDGSGTADKPAASQPVNGASSSTSPSKTSSSDTTSGASSGQDTQKPATSVSSDKAQAQSSQTTSQPPDTGNYYRPTLRRGKPTDPAPPYVVEEEPKRANDATSASSATPSAATVKLVPAISDEGGPELRSYAFFWKTGEENERRTQMLALAAADVRNYAAALVKNRILAKPPATKAAAAHKAAKAGKPVQPDFENIQFRAFDLWGKSQPVMVLTAGAHLPAAPGAATSTEDYDVALAATTDIYGNLRPLYRAVTDKYHLDVTAELHLIDAVDADGDGRGELLFSETSDAGSGYVIYRATADKLWKLFDSLGEQ